MCLDRKPYNFGYIHVDNGSTAIVHFLPGEEFERFVEIDKSDLCDPDGSALTGEHSLTPYDRDWPPLRLGELPPVEPFPLDVLPGSLAACVLEVSAAVGCDPGTRWDRPGDRGGGDREDSPPRVGAKLVRVRVPLSRQPRVAGRRKEPVLRLHDETRYTDRRKGWKDSVRRRQGKSALRHHDRKRRTNRVGDRPRARNPMLRNRRSPSGCSSTTRPRRRISAHWPTMNAVSSSATTSCRSSCSA